MYTIAVKPKRPTTLDGETSVKLPAYDLWTGYIENVHVIPARIDVPRFIRAIEETLQIYPHAAGQIVRSSDQWTISLTDSPIVVDIEDSDTTSLKLGEQPWVLQPRTDLGRFLRTKDCQPSRYPPDLALHHSQPDPGSSHCLLFVKLTIAYEETAIGVSWNHTLGDATVLLWFMQLLSRRYQGDDGPPIPVPSFTKRSFSSPDVALVEAYSPLMLHLSEACPAAEMGQRYAANKGAAEVAFKVTTKQLRMLRDRIVEGASLEVRPSLQDCLTAYIVNVINRYIEVPITQLTNVASYRAVPGAVNDPAVAGNAIYVVPCVLSPKSTLEENACSVRRSIMLAREPSFVEEYMRVANHLMLSACNEDRMMCFADPPGHASVNSNFAIDWHTAHFGYPSRVRFHTFGIDDRYIRVFLSNPDQNRHTAEVDVTEGPVADRSDVRERSLDVFFAIQSRIRDQIRNDIVSELSSPLFPTNVVA